MRPAFAVMADIDDRHPAQLVLVAADERTRLVDPVRVDAGLADASTEIRAILAQRWTAAELDTLDDDGRATLRMFAVDMALYRIALAFGRSTDNIKARYDAAVKRLEAMASGRGGLSFTGPGATAGGAGQSGPNVVVVEANDALFTRARFGSGG